MAGRSDCGWCRTNGCVWQITPRVDRRHLAGGEEATGIQATMTVKSRRRRIRRSAGLNVRHPVMLDRVAFVMRRDRARCPP